MQLTGIHHLTAITADAPANKRFYTDTLGERLALPPFLEPQRAMIEANLKPLD